jgi:hypothetical protein
MRRAVEDRARALDSKVRASAIVLATPGFVASILRGLITGVSLMSRTRVPMKIVASHEEALMWLAGELPRRNGRAITGGELWMVLAPLLAERPARPSVSASMPP